ncbi:ABC-2 type transport system ATP-binding protein [Roseimicrobium gellanilyticum]|uniref:ABC-2 type transport system ATP-binding protein n=1 Tax=Roseimicrobium gellanilyticum TaxID=748857 RepID=A0A366HD51_9BACT|nr:ABC transporter ATP-binding protein [Roseimicrobium gellanilyticum]RBP39769.1 ABC-2 type transport system ATP-binding protein [Roseimicrobium gellanilyticum]
MISANSLTKYFTRSRAALSDVSFSVNEGEICGLLGHNGAGKSTVLGIMLGMVRPDAGEVIIAGHSVQKERAQALRQIGAIFETPCFYEYMTGWRNLKTLCAFSGWWDEAQVKRTLDMVRLTDRIHSKVRTYSHGMRQRLALAQALLPMPKVLLLDEPTNGLDPEGIHEFRETVLRLRKEHGLTILLNSHLLAEVEMMCDRCIILREGQKVHEDVVKPTGETRVEFELKTQDVEAAQHVARDMGLALPPDGLIALNDGLTGPEVLSRFVKAGVRIDSWRPHRRTLEDIYLELSSRTPQGNVKS